MSPNLTEIGFIRHNKTKSNKISQKSVFSDSLSGVHKKVRCPPKVPPDIYLYIYIQ